MQAFSGLEFVGSGPFFNRKGVIQRKCTYQTRLGTRTKESNMHASLAGGKPKGRNESKGRLGLLRWEPCAQPFTGTSALGAPSTDHDPW